MGGLTRGELLRKLVHMGVGGLAFALRWLGPKWGAVCAAAAIVFNAFLFPRLGGRRLWREEEGRRGQALGILLYPITVLVLIFLFWGRLEIAAATWGILAFGDGMASVAGMTMGSRKLPWNPRKSWAGSLAYWLFGGAAAAVLLLWTAPGRYEPAFAATVAAVAALFAAALESLPVQLDDNLGVPIVTAFFLHGLVLGQGRWVDLAADPELRRRLLVGAAVNAALALLALLAGGVSRSGAAAGLALGTLIYACLDWRGFLLLVTFFVVGTAMTKLGYARKAAAGIAQERGGRRGARNALAKTSVPAACALFAAATPHPGLYTLAFGAAFAAAASDTAASEVGKAFGRRTFLVTSLRPVPPGTDGAMSVEGTLAGIAASFGVAAVGIAAGLLPAAALWLLPIAAFGANLLESLLGATLERRGWLDNESVNFLNTFAAALLAALFGLMLGDRLGGRAWH